MLMIGCSLLKFEKHNTSYKRAVEKKGICYIFYGQIGYVNSVPDVLQSGTDLR